MLRKRIICTAILAVTFFTSCSGVSLIKRPSGESNVSNSPNPALYSTHFLKTISLIKDRFKQGKADEALNDLKNLDETKLTPIEISFKRNLMGVIHFSKKRYEQAIYQFELSAPNASGDPALNSQVHLNLASSQYKMGLLDKAFDTISKSDPSNLNPDEQKKYNQLYLRLAHDLGKYHLEIEALTLILLPKNDSALIKSDTNFAQLLVVFDKLGQREKLQILETIEKNHKLLAGLVGLHELDKTYYSTENSGAKEILNWLQSNFDDHPEIKNLLGTFNQKVEIFEKIDSKNIGLVVPLTGKKSNFGERVLQGFDIAKKEGNEKTDEANRYIIKDSEGSAAIGANRVQELIEKDHVSVVIGGLFPDEAAKEYLEAKKYGVLFISLGQVYLPKEQKDHLLIEIPGSIESQLNQLFSKEMLNKFGKKAAILYPDDSMGQAYLDEFWRRSAKTGVQVVSLAPYEKSLTDFREPVKQLLGLKFKRERQEEFNVLNDLYALEKNNSVRRVQTLRPQIEFDWIFLPALPKETLQIVPIFGYFDAQKLNFVGGPSWRVQAVSKETIRWGDLYFIGDNLDPENPEDNSFVRTFVANFGQRPKLIEMTGYDSLNVAKKIVVGRNFSDRAGLDEVIRSKKQLSGLTGVWNLEDGLWIKTMTSLRLHRGEIQKAF